MGTNPAPAAGKAGRSARAMGARFDRGCIRRAFHDTIYWICMKEEGVAVRARYRLVVAPALLLLALVLAFARDNPWQYLTLAALFCLFMSDALVVGVPAAVRCVQDPMLCARAASITSDAVFSAALSTAMDAMSVRHLRTPGALYGAELVPYLVPIFMLCGMLLFLWWVFRTTLPRREKATLFVWMLARSAMAGFAFCAAFLGGEVRPACALGGLLMFVSAVIFLSRGIAGKDTEEGMGEKLSWATYYPGVALLTIGISLLY